MSQIQEAYQTLAEIDRLLADIELKITKIEGQAPTLERNLDTFRQVERLALRWLAIARRMGLPEEVDAAVNRIAQLITSLRMLQIASNLILTMHPLTAAIGVAGLIGGSMSLTDVFAGY